MIYTRNGLGGIVGVYDAGQACVLGDRNMDVL